MTISIVIAVNGHKQGGKSANTWFNVAFPDQAMLDDMRELAWQPIKALLRKHFGYLDYDPSAKAPLNDPPAIVDLGKGRNPNCATIPLEWP